MKNDRKDLSERLLDFAAGIIIRYRSMQNAKCKLKNAKSDAEVLKFDKGKHHRRSIRLKNYDYSQGGAYFVTICTFNKECLLGNILDAKVQLSEIGQVVADCWRWLGEQYDYVYLDEWIIMPNHLHGIIVITDEPDDRLYCKCRGGYA